MSPYPYWDEHQYHPGTAFLCYSPFVSCEDLKDLRRRLAALADIRDATRLIGSNRNLQATQHVDPFYHRYDT